MSSVAAPGPPRVIVKTADELINTVGDIGILPKVLDAAERFRHRPSDEEMQRFAHQWDLEPLFV